MTKHAYYVLLPHTVKYSDVFHVKEYIDTNLDWILHTSGRYLQLAGNNSYYSKDHYLYIFFVFAI